MPKLSIITVNLNNRDGLIKTAESIVAQTWADYEWIVIDGGSTDGSVDVIREYVDKTSKLVYWRSEKDGGIYYGMNRGIARAAGEYCYFLNSGDYLRVSVILEKVFTVEFDEDIVYGDMMLEKGDNRFLVHKFGNRVRRSSLLYGILPHQDMFIRTKLLNKKDGYRTDYKIVSDWVFYTEAICREKVSYRHIPVVFAINQRDGVSNSAKYWSVQKEERRRAANEMFSWRRRFFYFFSIASLRSKIGKIVYRVEKILCKRSKE